MNSSLNESNTVTLPPAEKLDFFFDFFLPGILLNLVGCLGLAGNAVSIFILSRPQMKSSTNCILIGLASYDIILIFTSILMFGLPSVYAYTRTLFSFYFWELFPYATPVVYPIGLIAQTSSAYLTLTVTIERYVAVCLPLRARATCTFSRARKCVLVIGACSVAYNVPRFFEVTWRATFDAEAGVNRVEVTPTWLRTNPTYISIYITWLYLLVMYIVPFASLAAFNLRIYLQVRRANAARARLSSVQRREIRMATMLMIVVLVFFGCNVLALVINVLEMMNILIPELTQVSNLLVTLNSSVNFIIYCTFGGKFKRLLCQTFCRPCSPPPDQHKKNSKQTPLMERPRRRRTPTIQTAMSITSATGSGVESGVESETASSKCRSGGGGVESEIVSQKSGVESGVESGSVSRQSGVGLEAETGVDLGSGAIVVTGNGTEGGICGTGNASMA